MKNKITILAILISILIVFSGCAELVMIDNLEVEATIIDSWQRCAYSVPIRCGNITTYVRHSAKYVIEVEYDELTLTIDNKDLYDEYKDRIGEKVPCTLVVKYYDDGSIYRKLIHQEVSE